MSTHTASRTEEAHALAATPAWLIQYRPRSAQALRRCWNAGEDFEYPAVDRHIDQIAADDLVFFWVSGRQAGIIGLGLASGWRQEQDHARNYRDPDGPRASRWSAEIGLVSVFDEPVLTREELRLHPAFEDFDLFKMPNRANAFAITREQSGVILFRLQEVLG